jgi:hypothetical protein
MTEAQVKAGLLEEYDRVFRFMNEVNGCRPRPSFYCQRCVFGSGDHRKDCPLIDQQVEPLDEISQCY